MPIEVNIEAERPIFEAAMRAEGRTVARQLPEYGGAYRFVEERWQGWLAARGHAPAEVPSTNVLAVFAAKLKSDDPAVRAEVEAHLARVDEEMRQARALREPEPEPEPAQPVTVPGGRFEPVGRVWHERVNDEYNANLDEALVSEGDVLYRLVHTSPDELTEPINGAGAGLPHITADVRARAVAWWANFDGGNVDTPEWRDFMAALGFAFGWVQVEQSLPHKATMVVATDFENYALAYQRYDLGETRWYDAHAESDNDVPLDFTPTHWTGIPADEKQPEGAAA